MKIGGLCIHYVVEVFFQVGGLEVTTYGNVYFLFNFISL